MSNLHHASLVVCEVSPFNHGTGHVYSILELVRAFEKVNGVMAPYVVDDRRAGDLAEVWSDPSKAWRELGWKAKKGLMRCAGMRGDGRGEEYNGCDNC